MKHSKKILVAAAVCVMAATSAVSLTACGGTEAADLTGTYTSGSMTFFSAYPGYTYKQLTTSVQVVNTYSDGSYQLIQTDKVYSGDLAFDASNSGDSDTSGCTNRGQIVTIYYGTYTSTEEEGILTLTISAPTAVVYSYANTLSGSGYVSTLAWTDDMATEDVATADAYLASVTYAQKSVVVDTSSYSFTFLDL